MSQKRTTPVTPVSRDGTLPRTESTKKRRRMRDDDLNDRVTFGVIVVLDSELEGLKLAIGGEEPNWLQESEQPPNLLLGTFTKDEKNFAICHTLNNQGQRFMGPAVGALKEKFPRMMLITLIGCSGAINDVNVGDVVAPQDVDHYDVRAAQEDDDVIFSGNHYNCDQGLKDLIARFPYHHKADYDEWINECKGFASAYLPAISPRLKTGVIASGNVVVKSEKYKKKLRKERGRHTLAVDTESAQFVFEARGEVKHLILRGICDEATKDQKMQAENMAPTLVEGQRPFENAPNQVIAVFNAASLFFRLLNKAYPGPTHHRRLVERFYELMNKADSEKAELDHLKDKIVQLLCTSVTNDTDLATVELHKCDGATVLYAVWEPLTQLPAKNPTVKALLEYTKDDADKYSKLSNLIDECKGKQGTGTTKGGKWKLSITEDLELDTNDDE